MPIHSSTLAWRIYLHDKSHIHDTLRARVQAGQLVLRWTKGYCTWFFLLYWGIFILYSIFLGPLLCQSIFYSYWDARMILHLSFYHHGELKWKSLSRVQLIETPPHGILQARISGMGTSPGIFPIQRLNSGLPHCRQILYQLSHRGSPLL